MAALDSTRRTMGDKLSRCARKDRGVWGREMVRAASRSPLLVVLSSCHVERSETSSMPGSARAARWVVSFLAALERTEGHWAVRWCVRQVVLRSLSC